MFAQKENAFNAIRLFLCLVVVFMHTLGHFGVQNALLLDGHMAVCGFFIISGFWITKSFLSSKNLKTFFFKRAKKILPMYYFSVIGFSILCVLFSSLNAKEYFSSPEYWKYLFWNCIFLNFAHPSLPSCFGGDAVNGALWTIKVEIGFYIILPLLMWIYEKLKTSTKQNIFFAVLYVLSVAYNLILQKYATKLHLPAQLAHQLPGFISFFVAGMWIFLNYDLFYKIRNYLIFPSLLAYFAHYATKTEILFPAALAVIIVWCAVQFKAFDKVGREIDFSWGIYLFHFPIMQILYYSIFQINTEKINAYLYALCTLSLSFMLTYIVEKMSKKKMS